MGTVASKVFVCPSIGDERKAMSQISNISSNAISGSSNRFPLFKGINLPGIFAGNFVHTPVGSITGIDLGLPSIINDILTVQDDYGIGRQACNNSMSVFGFLAFLLALLDLVMDNNNRRKRSTTGCFVYENEVDDHKFKEASKAAFILFTGFLGSLEQMGSSKRNSFECAKKIMCLASR